MPRGATVTAWTDLPGGFLAGVDPAYPHEDDLCGVLGGLAAARRGRSFLLWSQYQMITVLYDRLVAARDGAEGFVHDGYADCAARIARQAAISRRQAELLIEEAVALRDRLPEVADTLRDGVTADWQIRLIISRTQLVDADSPVTPVLDAEIAHTLRRRRGVWDRARLRDMVDRVVFRHDPEAVRERRRDALDRRGMWTHNLDDGAAEITGVMAAEKVRIAAAAVKALADAVCGRDGRTRNQRNSDAMFALLTGTGFECQCDREDCTARIPDPDAVLASVSTEVVIHVVTDAATLAGAPGIGFLDEHGVISDEHVRDLATRPDATIRPVTPVRTRPTRVETDPTTTDGGGHDRGGHRHAKRAASDATDTDPADADTETGSAAPAGELVIVYPASQPGDPYRPTQACADFVRVRDGYCTEPGCTRSAFGADADHVAEYDHAQPARGG